MAADTDLAIVAHQKIHPLILNPQDLGLTPAPTSELRGGDVRKNAEILQAVLQGKGTQAQQDVVALNTALALYVGEAIPEDSDFFDTFAQAIVLAREILRSGLAWKKLQQLAQFLR